MLRTLLGGGLLAAVAICAATVTAGAASTTVLPAAQFAKKADAICTKENVRRAQGPKLARFNPATATRAQIELAGKVLAYEYPIGVDEIAKINALGTPKEAIAHEAWTRLHRYLLGTAFPAIHKLATTGMQGKVTAFRTQFQALETMTTHETAFSKAIGFTVCGS
jgi:hypothetical protein